MKSKRGSEKYYFLVSMILAVLVLFMGIYFLFNELFTNKDTSFEVCKESILLRANLPEQSIAGLNLLSFKDQYPLRCKTKVININKKNVDQLGDIISEELVNCWVLFDKGDVNPFPRKLFSGHTYCFPCARIHLDSSLLKDQKSISRVYRDLKRLNEIQDFMKTDKFKELPDKDKKRITNTSNIIQEGIEEYFDLKIGSLSKESARKALESQIENQLEKEGYLVDIEKALKTHKLDGKITYWNYLKNSGRYYEPFNPGFANPFKFGKLFYIKNPLSFFQVLAREGFNQQTTIKTSSKTDSSIGFNNITLPSRILIEKDNQDIIIAYGTYVHDSSFNYGLDYIPYLFYYPSRETTDYDISHMPFVISNVPFSKIIKDAINIISKSVSGEKLYPSMCDSWVGTPA